jgi:hypothetical protein
MQLSRRMEVKPGIDRRKHEIDVLEQVMKGIRTQGPERGHAAQVVDIAVRGWAAGTVRTAIQVQVVDIDSDER